MARASLTRILDDLGGTLLEVVHGDPDRVGEVGGVVIHDAVEEPALPPAAVVLGVGLREPGEIAALLDRLRGRAGALLIRSPVPAGQRLRTAAADAGVVLLAVARGASWMQLAALLRSVLTEDGIRVEDTETLGGFPAGDLFSLANAIAAQLDAPVTIEDRGSRVLAFSGHQEEADQSRVETVLGRQVPQRYSQLLTESGVFDELYRSRRPVYVDSTGLGAESITMPRVAIAVRAGAEQLGSIWAAVHGPLSAEREAALTDAAKVVALHLLRVRAGADVGRRLRADLLSTALEGGPDAHAALDRLGLAGSPVIVLALAMRGPQDPSGSLNEEASRETERQRIADGFAMHLAAMHPRSAVALLENHAYGLLPVDGEDSDAGERALRVAGDFLGRLGDRTDAVIGIGSCARTSAELATARHRASRTVRALRAHEDGPRVARFAEVHGWILVSELRGLAIGQGDRPSGALARLREYDERHGASLVPTLAAWLDAFGDVGAAAAALHVHPNTFRYRLRRLTEIGGIDLADPEDRFAAMLALRVFTE
ncbi:PucR family transcriptional regulator [Sciscionella sediminilitoris]|uniref:PucR family transcriptional regulator n=1 Tax=Sciscionella sediminilitoris TaxID=1445613 RepID=UPI0004DF5A2C|nr:PucR family transcriptional regulator [Sciscionella sp. SE31]